MLRHEESAFVNAIPTLQVTPALLRELRMALSSRKKKTVVSAGSRRRTPGRGPKSSQRHPSRLAGKRKANELASSGDSMEPSIRRPAPDTESAPLPAKSSATGEQAADGSRQLSPPGVGVTYAAVLAGPPPRNSQVSLSSPQPWNRNRPNTLSQISQQTGACLTCRGP